MQHRPGIHGGDLTVNLSILIPTATATSPYSTLQEFLTVDVVIINGFLLDGHMTERRGDDQFSKSMEGFLNAEYLMSSVAIFLTHFRMYWAVHSMTESKEPWPTGLFGPLKIK